MLDEIRKRLSIKDEDKISFVNLSKYRKSFKEDRKGENKIAVIYAVGEINGGNGDDETIGSEGLSEAIRKARLDKKVKAVSIAYKLTWRKCLSQ